MNQIELTALAVNKKIITEEEGAKALWELVYTQKALFSLNSLEYDSFMDFLEYLQPKFVRILQSYKPAEGTFLAFLYANIRQNLLSWKKITTRRNVSEESCLGVMEIEYDSQAYKYSCCESCQNVFMEEENHTIEEVKKQIKENKIQKNQSNNSLKEEKLRKDAVLILALKSCYHITEDLIEKVCLITDTSKNKLENMICEARNSITTKLNRRNLCTKTRDNAFFYHRKYSLELPRINSHSNWAEILSKKYQRQTKIWELANLRLIKNYRLLVPSTKKVAELLGMSVRHCEYVMKKLNTDMDKIKLKWYPREHENLPCKLKS